MNEPIAVAMRNEEAIGRFFSFNPPSALMGTSFLIIEGIFLVGFALTIVHAVRHSRKEGNLSAVYTLVLAFAYGLIMDIISYYTVESFWHGEFTVMLVFNRLPLYIVLLYPTLIYHAFMTIRRYDFHPLIEALSVGFFGGLLYMIFDNIGPRLGWWIWDLSAPSTWPYVSGVPLTSYGWFFLFTGAFAWLCRKFCWDRITGVMAVVPIATVVLGAILFIPYSALAKNVPPWDRMPWEAALGAAALAHTVEYLGAGLVFVLAYRKPREPRDRWLMVFPLFYIGALTFLAIFTHDRPIAGSEPLSLLVIIPAVVASTAIVLLSHPTADEPSSARKTRSASR